MEEGDTSNSAQRKHQKEGDLLVSGEDWTLSQGKEGDLPVSGEDWTLSQGKEGSTKGVPKEGRCRGRGDPKEGKDLGRVQTGKGAR